jgi:hypothetical protein
MSAMQRRPRRVVDAARVTKVLDHWPTASRTLATKMTMQKTVGQSGERHTDYRPVASRLLDLGEWWSRVKTIVMMLHTDPQDV